jgi:hypothetical protein
MTSHRLRRTFWVLLVVVALYRAWLFRYHLVNDTVSYLDMGDEFFAGHFGRIVNGSWGPLYALLLGAWLHLLHVPPRLEYPAIHALLVGIFILCIACFEFFLRELLAMRARVYATFGGGEPDVNLPLTFIAYVIFAWSTLLVIGVEETNPDMLVAAAFLLACGLVVRIHNTRARERDVLALGATIAAGYLTKAVMLPIGVLLVVAAAAGGPTKRAKWRIAAVAGLSVCCIAAPQVATLSVQRGHFTTNETGPFNYAVHVQGVTYRHWQGETEGAGRPLHPTRKLLDSPAVFEFDGPLPGTYPFWFDTSYWYEGVVTHFDLRRVLAASSTNARSVAQQFFSINCAPLAAIVMLYGVAIWRRASLAPSLRFWIVILPALVALLPYATIHFEPRYVGAFLCAILVAVIAGAPVFEPWVANLYVASAILVGVMFVAPFGPSGTLGPLLRPPANRNNTFWTAAKALSDAGYGPGTKIAALEYANMGTVMAARLGRERIVAEVYYRPDRPETERNLFWNASLDDQRRALAALQSAGAKVVVTGDRPRGPTADEWIPLGDAPYSYHPL